MVWTVRHKDGDELGKLEQNNTVPAGSLDGAWGSTARIVADNAAGGMTELLSRVSGANEGVAAPGGG